MGAGAGVDYENLSGIPGLGVLLSCVPFVFSAKVRAGFTFIGSAGGHVSPT